MVRRVPKRRPQLCRRGKSIQCKATVAGRQCSLCTAKRFPYCWIHLRSICKLEVKKSAIQGAGMGLFASRRPARSKAIVFRAGTNIVEYDGPRVQHDPNDPTLMPYALDVEPGVVIDGANPLDSTVARYANDCFGGEESCNARFKKDRRSGKMYIEATDDIRNGKEIFVNYGPTYWIGQKKNADESLAKFKKRYYKEAPLNVR